MVIMVVIIMVIVMMIETMVIRMVIVILVIIRRSKLMPQLAWESGFFRTLRLRMLLGASASLFRDSAGTHQRGSQLKYRQKQS